MITLEENKKVGRPKNEIEYKKRSIMIDDELYKALQIKAIMENKDVSEVIRQVLRDNIEGKYFVNL